MIEGKGFILRTVEPADAKSLAQSANNFNVWINLRNQMPHPYQLADAENFIRLIANQNPAQNLGIEISGKIMGMIGATRLSDVYQKTADFGYWLDKSLWGRGIMTEVIHTFIPYAFENFDIFKLSAGVYGHNKASVRILEKNGFELEGVLRNHVYKNGVILDELRYARFISGI